LVFKILDFGAQDISYDFYPHRDDDQPALVNTAGGREWYKYGRPHRDNGLPAVIDGGDYIDWYKNGRRYEHIIKDVPYVACPYCGKKYKVLSNIHLRSNHLKTLKKVKIEFPGRPTMCKSALAKRWR